MKRLAAVSALTACSLLAFLVACDDDPTSGATGVTFPEAGSFQPVDSGSGEASAPEQDAGDAAAAVDADAGKVEDAGVDAAFDAGDPTTYLGVIGSQSGASHADRCPAGQLMIGVEGGAVVGGFYGGVLSAFRTICGTPTLPAGGNGAVTIGAGATVPANAADARGTVAVTVTQVTCPANQVVVGVTGKYIGKNFPPVIPIASQFDLACASLTMANGVVTVSASTTVTGIGSTAGTVQGPYACGAGRFSTGTRVGSGDVTNGVEVRCEPAVLP